MAAAGTLTGDEATGARMVAKALEAPLKQIAENAGMEGGVQYERHDGANPPAGGQNVGSQLAVFGAARLRRRVPVRGNE